MTEAINPQLNLRRLYEDAPRYAKAKAERIYIEEFRKSLKAQLMKKCGEQVISAQEREAYASPEYVQLLEGLRDAVEREETLRWRMVQASAAIEVWRSQEASARNMDRGAA